MKNILVKICLTLVCLMLGNLVHADSKSGWAAWENKNYQQAYSECADLAQKGDASCQALLGTLYKYGFGVPQDNNLSLKWLTHSAEQGNATGQEVLGDTLVWGSNGVEKDIAKAYDLFMKASAKGNTFADNQLGSMYRNGIHVNQNLTEALRYFQSAAGKGNPAAQVNLASMYRDGVGVPKNPDLAFQWALKSSEKKWGDGLNFLGLLHRDGIGVRQDSEKAISLFKEAIATNRSSVSYSNIGRMYYDGTGIPVNKIEARKWFEAGIKVNDPESFGYMSDIHVNLSKDSPANQAKAFEYEVEAAGFNRPLGLTMLGYVYRQVIGHPVDYPKAIFNFEKSVTMEYPYAMYHLAFMYAKGMGVPANPTEAVKLYQRAIS